MHAHTQTATTQKKVLNLQCAKKTHKYEGDRQPALK